MSTRGIGKETRDENWDFHSFNDEPSIVSVNGSMMWHKHGECHRINGPAIITANGSKSYYIDGKKLSFNEWIRLSPLPEEEKTELLLSN